MNWKYTLDPRRVFRPEVAQNRLSMAVLFGFSLVAIKLIAQPTAAPEHN